jgi:hypothetical protein
LRSSSSPTAALLILGGGLVALLVAAYVLTGRAPDISLLRGRGYLPVAGAAACEAIFLGMLWLAARRAAGARAPLVLACLAGSAAAMALLLEYSPTAVRLTPHSWELAAAQAALGATALAYVVLWSRGWGAALRGRTADLVLSLCVTLVTLAAAEGVYRFYLWRTLIADVAERAKDPPDPTFMFYTYPPPWRFDKELGFAFLDGPTLGGAIAKGAFASCDPVVARGNRYGNTSEVRGDYPSADIKIAWFGSSFTMGDPGWRGDTTTNQLQAMLSEQLGKRVAIMNYSRDATGILTMLDIARARIAIDRPDLILFTFNSTAPAYQRQWRIIQESRPGFYRMYQSLDPSESAPPDRRIASGIPISKHVTPEWCRSMESALAAADTAKLRTDPLVLELIAEYNVMRREREAAPSVVDLTTLSASFLFNRLVRNNPFFGMKIFADNTIYGQLAIAAMSDDPQFAAAMEYVRGSRVPFHLIHIPTRFELQSGRQYEFPSVGVAQARGLTLVRSFEAAAGREVLDLAPYYAPEVRAKARDFVVSDQDDHPNAAGIRAMAEAFDRLLLDKVFTHEGTPRVR